MINELFQSSYCKVRYISVAHSSAIECWVSGSVSLWVQVFLEGGNIRSSFVINVVLTIDIEL